MESSTNNLEVAGLLRDIVLAIQSRNIQAAYPVGSIYFNASTDANPEILLGFGTWEQYAKGRVLVGQDTSQSEFNTLEETSGAKTHTLTTSEIPSHTHTINGAWSQNTGYGNINIGSVAGANRANIGGTASNTGGDGAHNNLQPYIVVYIWKRTA